MLKYFVLFNILFIFKKCVNFIYVHLLTIDSTLGDGPLFKLYATVS